MCFIIALHWGSKRVYKYAIKIQKHAFSTLNLPSAHFFNASINASLQIFLWTPLHLFLN